MISTLGVAVITIIISNYYNLQLTEDVFQINGKCMMTLMFDYRCNKTAVGIIHRLHDFTLDFVRIRLCILLYLVFVEFSMMIVSPSKPATK